MDKYLEKAEQTGLLDVIKDWMKNEKYISVSRLQREFSIGYLTASSIFNYLVEENLVEKEQTYSKGHRVINYNPLSSLNIYMIDINYKIVEALKKEFAPYQEVKVIKDDFKHFMDTHRDVECVVSPANSFGYMDGGYDKAITDYFGKELEQEVQRYINKHLFGEQPVGTSIIVYIPHTDKKLIHTPTMILPSPIKEPLIIYQCMRSTLMMAINNKVHSIVIPAFGGSTGKVNPTIIAGYMRKGYEQIIDNLKNR